MKKLRNQMTPRIKPITTRIPEVNVVDRIPAGTVFEPLPPPVITTIPQPTINVPSGEIPSYEPIDVPPNLEVDVRVPPPANESISQETPGSRSLPPGTTSIDVPFTDASIPVPTAQVAVLTLTTAITATSAALLAKPIAEGAIKWLVKQIKKKLLKLKAKMAKNMSPLELQMYLEYEGSAELKKLTKKLAKEQKASKEVQQSQFVEQQRQSKPQRKGN